MNPPISTGPFADGDPLDARLASVQGVQTAGLPPRPSGRLTPALTAPHTRALILLPLGFALGPSGLHLLSDPVLSFVDPLVSVGLAMLGALVGMAIDVRRSGAVSLAGAAALEWGSTLVAVSAGVLVLHTALLTPGSPPWLFALLLGICASASISPSIGPGDQHALRLAQVGDFDNVLAIALGALVLALHRAGSVATAATLIGGLSLVALAVAVSGWLLVAYSSSERERHTFVAGTLLLLGGAAAYLGHSALFVGLVAGVLWAEAGGPAGDRIGRDLRYVQRPLVVLLLLVAGSRLTLGLDVLALAVIYVTCRTAGKLGGAWALGRSGWSLPAPVTGADLLAPGIVGAAFALNILQAGGDHAHAGALLAVVALGAIGTDVIAMSAGRRSGVA